MPETRDYNPDEITAEDIHKVQYALALRYSLYTPDSVETKPTEEYQDLLEEFGIPYLPVEVMDELEADWMKQAQIRLTLEANRKHLWNFS